MAEQKQWYEEYQTKLQAQQASKSRDEIAADLQKTSEHVFDPATAPKQSHNWVDRGLVLSCEGANHPHHRAWKRQKVSL